MESKTESQASIEQSNTPQLSAPEMARWQRVMDEQQSRVTIAMNASSKARYIREECTAYRNHSKVNESSKELFSVIVDREQAWRKGSIWFVIGCIFIFLGDYFLVTSELVNSLFGKLGNMFANDASLLIYIRWFLGLLLSSVLVLIFYVVRRLIDTYEAEEKCKTLGSSVIEMKEYKGLQSKIFWKHFSKYVYLLGWAVVFSFALYFTYQGTTVFSKLTEGTKLASQPWVKLTASCFVYFVFWMLHVVTMEISKTPPGKVLQYSRWKLDKKRKRIIRSSSY